MARRHTRKYTSVSCYAYTRTHTHSRTIYLFLSPLRSGGISPGDVITHINGTEIKSSNDVYDILAPQLPLLTITVFRDGETLTVKVSPVTHR